MNGRTQPGRWSPRDWISVATDLWIWPPRWHRSLRFVPLPEFMDEVERAARRAPALSLPLPLSAIACLARRRAGLSLRWRRTRCFLKGLLLFHVIARSRQAVTLHIGCALGGQGRLAGHCWLSSPDVPDVSRILASNGMTEMFSRTYDPGAAPRQAPAAETENDHGERPAERSP